MSIAPEIVEIALKTLPDQATIVPERRQEVTTEGGIDLTGDADATAALSKLRSAGIFVSAFIDPDEKQVIAAAQQGFDAVELHTGEYCNATNEKQLEQLDRLQRASQLAREKGLRLHAGHGLNFHNVLDVAQIADMRELNVGHAIISRAIFVGLRQAVREMKDL